VFLNCSGARFLNEISQKPCTLDLRRVSANPNGQSINASEAAKQTCFAASDAIRKSHLFSGH
jgi:hypothetical protein